MKNWLLIAVLVSVLILAGCSSQAPAEKGNTLDLSGQTLKAKRMKKGILKQKLK